MAEATRPIARRFGWGLMTVFATLIGAYALANALVPGLRTPFVAELFASRAARAFGHMGFGGIALFTGALQFSTRLRFDRPATHRLVGKIYIVTVLVSGVSAGLLAPMSTGGVTAHFGFGLLALLWLGTTSAAWITVRRGAYDAHRVWMIRSYALCLAAVTLRLYLPLAGIAGLPFEVSYPAIAWLCWVPNLVVAEWFVVGSSLAPLEPVGS